MSKMQRRRRGVGKDRGKAMREQRTKVKRGQPVLSEQEEKQILEILENHLIHAYSGGRGGHNLYSHEERARRILSAIRTYFKPHLRGEFPREDAEKLGNYYFGVMSIYISKPNDAVAQKTLQSLFVENFIKCFEHLWNGEVLVGTCPTCGGDKEVPYYGDMCDGTGRCPDCTEEKERRKKGPSSPPWSVKG
ncbi:hypothetical protein LCGC14_0601710, partial [marine sediment metagenome]